MNTDFSDTNYAFSVFEFALIRVKKFRQGALPRSQLLKGGVAATALPCSRGSYISPGKILSLGRD
jgi:hypothetical protein